MFAPWGTFTTNIVILPQIKYSNKIIWNKHLCIHIHEFQSIGPYLFKSPLVTNIQLTAYPILASVGFIEYPGELSNEYILAYHTWAWFVYANSNMSMNSIWCRFKYQVNFDHFGCCDRRDYQCNVCGCSDHSFNYVGSAK